LTSGLRGFDPPISNRYNYVAIHRVNQRRIRRPPVAAT
jgi:hypothetical protein